VVFHALSLFELRHLESIRPLFVAFLVRLKVSHVCSCRVSPCLFVILFVFFLFFFFFFFFCRPSLPGRGRGEGPFSRVGKGRRWKCVGPFGPF